MGNNVEVRKENDSKKIFAMIIMIATLMVCTTSATYAYFAIAPVSNNTISGTAATAGLTLDVTKDRPRDTQGKLVPQKSSAIATALNNYSCIDGNGNTVCLRYAVTITNTSTAVVVVDGTIQFSGVENMPNLKWYMYPSYNRLNEIFDDADNEDSSGMSASITTPQTLVSNVSLTAPSRVNNTNKVTYYVVIWLRETGQEQTDSGTFTATITFTSSNGTGVTSTITA